jgi:hypothetical protein
VGHLGEPRHSAAFADWLAITTCREFSGIRMPQEPQPPGTVLDAEILPERADADGEAGPAATERHAVLREALARLPYGSRQLIAPAHRRPTPVE